MALRDMIDESVLADASKIDRFLSDNGVNMPSVANTLRIIREIDPQVFRRVAEDVWGVGGSDGRALFVANTEACDRKLTDAANGASAWTGEAKNAYSQRIALIKEGIQSMEEPAENMGKALQEIADAFEFTISDIFNNVLSIVGVAVTVIGLVVSIIGWICGATGVGAVVGIVAGIVGLLAGIGTIIVTVHSRAEAQNTSLTDGSSTAQTTMDKAKTQLAW